MWSIHPGAFGRPVALRHNGARIVIGVEFLTHGDNVAALTSTAGALIRQPLAAKVAEQMRTTEEYRRLEKLDQEVQIASRRREANQAAAEECECRRRRAAAELLPG